MASQTGNTVHLTNDSFKSEVLDAKGVALVDFWAEWCGPCKALGPTIDALADEFQGKAKIAKVDVDSNQQLAMDYDVQSIPTLLFFKDGQLVGRHVGLAPRDVLANKINGLMA
jgi:thioredoxin 1